MCQDIPVCCYSRGRPNPNPPSDSRQVRRATKAGIGMQPGRWLKCMLQLVLCVLLLSTASLAQMGGKKKAPAYKGTLQTKAFFLGFLAFHSFPFKIRQRFSTHWMQVRRMIHNSALKPRMSENILSWSSSICFLHLFAFRIRLLQKMLISANWGQ